MDSSNNAYHKPAIPWIEKYTDRCKWSLATNNDPNKTGGTLTIRRLHTNQTDIALFTGRRLSNEQINLPEDFDAHGTVAGSINDLSTNLTINSSVGTAFVNGRLQISAIRMLQLILHW
jgi:hypothetical protein